MLIYFAIVTSNILEYIKMLLKLLSPVSIYKQPFDRPNLIYMIISIRKVRFKDIVFIILSASTIFNISKTMIFVN